MIWLNWLWIKTSFARMFENLCVNNVSLISFSANPLHNTHSYESRTTLNRQKVTNQPQINLFTSKSASWSRMCVSLTASADPVVKVARMSRPIWSWSLAALPRGKCGQKRTVEIAAGPWQQRSRRHPSAPADDLSPFGRLALMRDELSPS